jgi:hypothetical protein
MPVELLTPGLASLHSAFESGVGLGDILFVHWPGSAAVAGGPIGTAQPGIGQPDEGAEHDDDQSEQYCYPGQAMEMSMRTVHGLTAGRVMIISAVFQGLS